MGGLFNQGELRLWLAARIDAARESVKQLDPDKLLSIPVDDTVHELVAEFSAGPLVVSREAIDGAVRETRLTVVPDFSFQGRSAIQRPGTAVWAVYPFEGDPSLFQYRPSQSFINDVEGVVAGDRVSVESSWPGSGPGPEVVKRTLASLIDKIAQMAEWASRDAAAHNDVIVTVARQEVETRRQRLLDQGNLRGALGFPLERRPDAPKPVPLHRKRLSIDRSKGPTKRAGPYRDEWAIDDAAYHEVLGIIGNMLTAFERSPSIIASRNEERLRDQILVQLNGTFHGQATGETFVAEGKTDILVRSDDRHVFVGECKWWKGPKAFSTAIDQLLSYLPWRDEKAALILFTNSADATSIIKKADTAVREHASFKRPGAPSHDATSRRDYVLGHPDDPSREIRCALLLGVIRVKDSRS